MPRGIRGVTTSNHEDSSSQRNADDLVDVIYQALYTRFQQEVNGNDRVVRREPVNPAMEEAIQHMQLA